MCATCAIRPPSHREFKQAKSTPTDGLALRLRCDEKNIPQTSFHMSASASIKLHKRCMDWSDLHEIAPAVDSRLSHKVKRVASKRRRGEDTLTSRSHSVTPTTALEGLSSDAPDSWLSKRQRLVPSATYFRQSQRECQGRLG